MLAGRLAPHYLQNLVIDMLQRDVYVLRHLRIRCDRVHELVAPVRWMRVQKPDPKLAIDSSQTIEQSRQGWSTTRVDRLTRPCLGRPQIHSVIGGVLADQV